MSINQKHNSIVGLLQVLSNSFILFLIKKQLHYGDNTCCQDSDVQDQDQEFEFQDQDQDSYVYKPKA